MNETLEAMARAIFKDWFVDFGPTRAKMEGRAPYLAPDIWALFPECLDDDGKPEGWFLEPFLDHAQIISGGTPKTDVREYWDGPIAWASAKDVSQCGEMFLVGSERSITERGLAAERDAHHSEIRNRRRRARRDNGAALHVRARHGHEPNLLRLELRRGTGPSG